MAFAARGEIWAASSRDGGDAVRVTRSYARDAQVAWLPDSRRIVYVSERDGVAHLFLYDFTTSKETQLTSAKEADTAPRVAPDGKSIAFVRDGKELRVLDVESKAGARRSRPATWRDRRAALAWSPDSRWVAYIGLSGASFRNVFAVPAAGGASRAVTSIPNGSANNISWSPDGTYIIFNTSQRTEERQTVRVDLILRTPRFREDRFRDLFRDEPSRTPRPDRRRRRPPARDAARAASATRCGAATRTRRSRSRSCSTTSAGA